MPGCARRWSTASPTGRTSRSENRLYKAAQASLRWAPTSVRWNTYRENASFTPGSHVGTLSLSPSHYSWFRLQRVEPLKDGAVAPPSREFACLRPRSNMGAQMEEERIPIAVC
jgi:hypothetical protein